MVATARRKPSARARQGTLGLRGVTSDGACRTSGVSRSQHLHNSFGVGILLVHSLSASMNFGEMGGAVPWLPPQWRGRGLVAKELRYSLEALPRRGYCYKPKVGRASSESTLGARIDILYSEGVAAVSTLRHPRFLPYEKRSLREKQRPDSESRPWPPPQTAA